MTPSRGGSDRTLILALTVLALVVVGVLAGSQLLRHDDEDRQALNDMDNVASRIELYKAEVGRYPAAHSELAGRYTKESELRDAWGNPYVYAVPGTEGRAFDLTTLGADGAPGGEGRNRDRTWKKAH